jgi:phytoene synthase
LKSNEQNIESENLNLTRKSKTNFIFSTFFLNKEKSNALNAIYAFCRISDDIVDDDSISDSEKVIKFNKWKNEFTESLNGNTKINEYRIDKNHFLDLLKGMEMDLNKKEFKTFKDLYEYCLCVASTVGLIFIKITGYKNPDTVEYAVNLGVALQLTNILRDIKKDIENGRVYIPEEDLEKFKYSKEDISKNLYNENFVNLIKYEINRAKSYYEKANKYLDSVDYNTMLPARIIDKTYFKILKKIEKKNYNIYSGSVRLSKILKIIISIGVFLKTKFIRFNA